MPGVPVNATKSSNNKKDPFKRGSKPNWLDRQISDLAGAARGAPGAVLQGIAASAALGTGNTKPLKKQAKIQEEAIKELADPNAWKEHTALQALTALGVAAPVLKGASVAGAAARAPRGGRIAAAKNINKDPKTGKPKTRKVSYRPKNADEAKLFQQISGSKKLDVTEQSTYLPQSKVVLTAAAQKALDRVRAKNPNWQKRKVLKGVARDRDILDRAANPDLQAGIIQGTKDALSKESLAALKKPSEWMREGNAGIRLLRLYRMGYIPPNLAGAVATNLIESPIGTLRAAKSSRNIRGESAKQKMLHRGIEPRQQRLLNQKDAVMGEGAAQGASELTGSGPIATFSRGVGQTFGKITDRESRRRHFDIQARKQGYDPNSLESMEKLLRSRQDLIQVGRRGEDAGIRFTRNRPLKGVKMTPLQKLDQKAAENLFLYRWLTGSAGYTGRMIKEKPTLSAALANAGQEAPKVEDLVGDRVPQFIKDNYIPAGIRNKMPWISNMQAATLFGTPGETATYVQKSLDDPRNIIDPLQPVQRAAAVAALGYDPFRGQELATRANPFPSWLDRAQFGFETETRSIPHKTFYDYLTMSDKERSGKLFPRSKANATLAYLLGGPTPTPYNAKVGEAMWKREQDDKEWGKPRKTKKKSRKGF